MTRPTREARARDAALRKVGFRRTRDETGWSMNGYRLVFDGAWAEVRCDLPESLSDPLREESGRPGLWRSLEGSLVFEIPPMPHREVMPPDETDQLAALVAWALRTASGRPVPGWPPPLREAVEAAIPGGAFSIRTHELTALGTIHHEPDRLALRVPAIARTPADLPESRRLWLEETLLETRRLNKLVRLGLQNGAVQAEVDLTGAPLEQIAPLCRIAVDALRWVVGRIQRPLNLILDAGLRSEVLDRNPGRARSARRSPDHV